MNMSAPSIALIDRRAWPIQPYKGLDYYEVQDAPLFAGRSRDVKECARRLAAPSVRALVLQGSTGCGKSSFLRAGLIPYLESQSVGFAFPREHENPVRALFIRSTQSPLRGLAAAVHAFASERSRTASTDVRNGLTRGTCGIERQQHFVAAIGTNFEKLRECMGYITDVIPETLVLVVDQLEEILTLDPRSSGDVDRNAFFDFISLLEDRPVDAKLILSMRTEYYGKIFDRIQATIGNPSAIDQYLLDDLSEEEMIEAIERPTLDRPVGSFPAPHGIYHFRFEEGLPQTIVKDLKAALPIGGILPVLQIVCGRLFYTTASAAGKDVTIMTETYRDFGGVRGQLYRYLVEGTLALCVEKELSFREAYAESERWRGLVLGLARPQADGSVISDIVSRDELAERASRARCRIPFGDGAGVLSSGEPRLLRGVSISDEGGVGIRPAYALGHDAIGLAGLATERFQARADEMLFDNLRRQGIVQTAFLTALLTTTSAIVGLLSIRGINLTWFQLTLLYVPIICCIASSVALTFNPSTQGAVIYAYKKIMRIPLLPFDLPTETDPSQYDVEREIYARLSTDRIRRRQVQCKRRLFDTENGPETEWREAAVEARKLIRSDQADFAIYINLARGQRRRDDLEGAIITLTEGIMKAQNQKFYQDKNLSVLYYNRACYLALLHDKNASDEKFRAALEDLESCLAHSPTPISEIEDMLKDTDLNALTKTAEFVRLAERVV